MNQHTRRILIEEYRAIMAEFFSAQDNTPEQAEALRKLDDLNIRAVNVLSAGEWAKMRDAVLKVNP